MPSMGTHARMPIDGMDLNGMNGNISEQIGVQMGVRT